MHIIITILLALNPAQAADDTGASDCDDWGQIAQDVSVVDVVRAGDGETVLNASSTSCGDVNECEWTLEGGIEGQQTPGRIYECGDVQNGGSTAFGGSICYLPADSLLQCRGFDFQIVLDCPNDDDGNDPGSSSVQGTISDLSPECTVNASVSGGGCISAQGSGVATAAWLLFPMIGLGGLARRRED